MKRKFLSIIFAICLMTLSSVFFVACGEDPPPENPKYNITLDPNGGTLPSDQSATITIEKDAKFAWPKLPTKSGYDFIGWTLDSAGNDYYKFDTTLASKDITLYAQYVAENTYTYELDEETDTYIITGGDNTLTRIVTPFMHGGKAVSGIGYAAFVEFEEEPDEHGYPVTKNNETIREVIITPNIKTIDDGAFSVAKNLESVYFYDGCETLDMAAFDSCDKLTSVRLPETLTTLGAMTFNDCNALTTIKIPNSITKLQARLFSYCENLTSVEFGDITKIGEYCFEDTKISSFNFPSTLTTIGAGAFWGTEFTSVTVPATVTFLGRSAFACCDKLETATLMGNVAMDNTTQDDYGVFAFCKKLKTVNLPDTLTEISRNMFYGCSALERFTLPRDCTSIKYRAFYHCTNLTDFTFNEKLEYIGEKAFVGAKITVHTLPDSVKTLGDYIFNHHSEGSNCHIYINRLPSSLETIYWHALYGLDGLYINELPAGLTYIEGPSPFGINTSYAETLRIPEGTTGIVREAFYNEAVNKVVLPQGLERIGIESFRYSNLTEINIPASVTSIGEYAFANCQYLTKITFEGNNIDIHPTAFEGTTGVGILTVGENVTEIAQGQYSGSEYSVVIIPGNVERIGARAFENCTKIQQVIFKEGLQIIDEDAFKGCTSITNLRLPDSVVSVGKGAFYGIDNLEFLELGEGFDYDDCTFDEIFSLDKKLMEINNRSSKDLSDYIGGDSSVLNIYDGDTESSARVTEAEYEWFITDNDVILLKCLTDIFIDGKENLVLPLKKNGKDYRIGDYAFADKEGLVSVTLPSGLKGIGKGAFENCRNLMSINIPSGVTRIEDETFSLCGSLRNITLHNNVTYIGKEAFLGCSHLTDFDFPTALEYVGYNAFSGTMETTLYNDIDYVGPSNNPHLIAVGINDDSTIKEISFHTDCKFVAMDAYNWNSSNVDEITIHSGIICVDMCVDSGNYDEDFCRIYVHGDEKEDWNFDGDYWFDDNYPPYRVLWNADKLKTYENLMYMVNADNTVTIVCFVEEPSQAWEVVIPETIESYPVTTIAESAFRQFDPYIYSYDWDCKITLNDNITYIGDYAFFGSGVKNITLPRNIEYIGDYAFNNTGVLYNENYKLFMPDSLTYVGKYAFQITSSYWNGCNVPIYIEYSEIPNTWATDWVYNWDVFTDTNLEYPNLVMGVKYYGDNGSGLKYVVFSDNTAGIVDYQVSSTESSPITIPATITHLGTTYNVTKVGDFALYGKPISSLTLNEGIVTIGNYAFYTPIEGTLVLPSSLDHVGISAFGNLSNELYVKFNEGLLTIGDYGFYSNVRIVEGTSLPSTLHTIGECGLYGIQSTEDFIIPATIVNLGYNAFGAMGLKPRYFAAATSKPTGWDEYWDTVKVYWGFTGTYSNDIYKFGLMSDNTAVILDVMDDYLIEPDYDGDVAQPVRLPDTVTVGTKTYTITDIGYEAMVGGFTYHEKVNIIIPYTYEYIEYGAFYNEEYLGSVTIEDTSSKPSRLAYIGDKCFYGSSITSINLPASLTYLGYQAFYYCESLVTVNSSANLETIYTETFYSCGITTINLGNKLKAIGSSAFAGCYSLVSITLPSTIESLADSAFNSCTSLATINLPEGLKAIGAYCFSCCPLTSIDLPSTLTSLGEEAFSYTNIATLVIPGGITQVNGFYGSCSLLVCGEGVESIGFYIGGDITIVLPTSLERFSCWWYSTEYNIKLCYLGTPAQFESVTVSNVENIDDLLYYYSATEPTDNTHNYWHFDTDGVTPVYW